jgi:hypothetical protein
MSDQFNPDDLEEIGDMFESIIKDSEMGYVVELHMTRLAAKEIVKLWLSALRGNEDAVIESLGHYAYMISEIMMAIKEDDD